MALDMTTALTIKAKVDGVNQIDGLTRSLDKANNQATGLGGAFSKLGGMASKASAALAALGTVAIGGLAVMGKNAIDAADNINDLSQRTGVGVEALSKFGAAAEDSGSTLDEVGKAMGKLAKGIVDPASKTSEALQSIGISSVDAKGKIRTVDQVMLDIADKFSKLPDGAQKTALAMQIFGKSGANLIPMLNGGREAMNQYSATITTEMAQASDKFNDSLNAIARSVAGPFNQAITALLPLITQLAEKFAALAQSFSQLPESTQTLIAGIAALAAGALILAPAIASVVTTVTAIAPLISGISIAIAGIPALIAGWAGAIGPLIGALGTLGQVLIGIFSGPVGWIALLTAAGVAIYAFRDQIAQVFKSIYQAVVSAFQNMAGALRAPFEAAASFIGNIFGSILRAIAGRINFVISLINRLISGYNRLPSPDIPLIPQISVPAFADGGVVNRPTLAMVGEGGEREFIIPESKMATASANYLAGVRGGSVIPRGNSATATNGTVVNIRTGPVMQQDGQQYVTMGDLEGALQTMADTLLGNGRSTGGRRYAGIG